VPLVLAIEPDLRQATIVKRIVREKVLADVAVVDSRDAALEAIRLAMPDVLLLSALLSPRDEDELIAHLRTLDHAGHLQTHTIPQLASSLRPDEERASGGLLSAFRRKKKKDPAAAAGCDPEVFAEEIRSYLQRAAEMKREQIDGQAAHHPQDHAWRAAQPQKGTTSVVDPAPASDVEPSASSSWASPFEWKPSNPSSLIANPESFIADPESPIAHAESLITHPESLIAPPESRIAHPEEPLTLMSHLRPPSGITRLQALRDSLAEETAELAAPIEVRAPEPTPVPEPPPAHEVAIVQELPIVQEVVFAREAAIPAPAPVQETAPVQKPASIPDKGYKDSGLGIRDKRSGMRDSRLGTLASWARAERNGRDAAEKTDDLYGLLMGLAVPPAVVAVGYGRGCRIRRVRVPAAAEPTGHESTGPVIVSKRVLAEQREHRGA
jgi:CheY-like chemotaxis protein